MEEIKPNHFASMRGTTQVIRSNGRILTIRNNRNRFFFPDEWKAFYDALKTKQQKITFAFLINTGARIMEVQNIKVNDIDFQRGNIVLRVTKRIIHKPGIQTKGERKIRILSISTEFTKYLYRFVKENNLGPEDYFPILTKPGANIAMKEALKSINIKDWDMFSLHNVRKTLETWLIALDVDSMKLVKHFGHTLAVASKHYVSPDIFNYQDKSEMREIIGDLFAKER